MSSDYGIIRYNILTKQFRMPSYLNENEDGMMIEVCAGLLDTDDPLTCIKKEAEEERVRLEKETEEEEISDGLWEYDEGPDEDPEEGLSSTTNESRRRDVFLEIDENMLYGMLSNPDFYMFCSDDLQNFVSLYITTDINHNNEIKVGNVYLFYQSNSLISYTIQKLTNICDILVFPCIFCNNIKGSTQYYKYNFHLFQHSSIQIDYNNNFLQIF